MGAVGTEAAERALLTLTPSTELRIFLASHLRRGGADGHEALKFAQFDRPDLTAELVRWLGKSDPEAAAAFLLAQLSGDPEPESVIAEAVGYIRLTNADRAKLLDVAAHRAERTRVIVTALIGDPEQASMLLVDPSRTVRELTLGYIPARADWNKVLDRAQQLSNHPDPVRRTVEQAAAEVAKFKASLEHLPRWALLWRADWLQNLGAFPLGGNFAIADIVENLADTDGASSLLHAKH
jgi:hypothetical protein